MFFTHKFFLYLRRNCSYNENNQSPLRWSDQIHSSLNRQKILNCLSRMWLCLAFEEVLPGFTDTPGCYTNISYDKGKCRQTRPVISKVVYIEPQGTIASVSVSEKINWGSTLWDWNGDLQQWIWIHYPIAKPPLPQFYKV